MMLRLFRLCTSKINNTFVDYVEDLDIVIPMFNVLEYSDNYSMRSGSLWNYYRDEVNNHENENQNNFRVNNNKTTRSKSFEHKIKIRGKTPDNASRLDTVVVVPLKYLSNFWRSLDLRLINCEVELDLWWTKEWVISEISRKFR